MDQPSRWRNRHSTDDNDNADVNRVKFRQTSAFVTVPLAGLVRKDAYSSKQGFCPAMEPSNRCNFCAKRSHFQAVCFAAVRQQQPQ
jgi:hypothetical protein